MKYRLPSGFLPVLVITPRPFAQQRRKHVDPPEVVVRSLSSRSRVARRPIATVDVRIIPVILPGIYPEGKAPERGAETVWGNPAATPMMVASWQVQEVVKIITGRGQPLRNRMLFMDAEQGTVEILTLGEP